MKTLRSLVLHGLPFLFAIFLCQFILSRIPGSEMKSWEPGFYSYLPMCFFFVGVVTFRMEAEIRELRDTVEALQATRGNAATEA